MKLVIADTSPLNYLILIRRIDLLPMLFDKVILPQAVATELMSQRTPQPVRHWIATPPAWLEVRDVPSGETDASLANIDGGERAAIELACALRADLVLMDDRKGVLAAERKGLLVTGTLGVLDIAAERGLVDFAGGQLVCLKSFSININSQNNESFVGSAQTRPCGSGTDRRGRENRLRAKLPWAVHRLDP